jgi:hypothetical protein
VKPVFYLTRADWLTVETHARGKTSFFAEKQRFVAAISKSRDLEIAATELDQEK